MKKKRPSWNLRFGNKGMVFVLDIILAVFVTLLLISHSYYYISKSREDKTSSFHMIRVGSDMALALDNLGLLTPDKNDDIEEMIPKLLPASYEMRIEVEYRCECEKETPIDLCSQLKDSETCNDNYILGLDLPEKEFVASGKRFFTSIKDVQIEDDTLEDVLYYGLVQYWVWLK